MAAKLQCEICGGKLVGMPGGVFECEACGTEYSTAWAKAKIQEITGTVKVEGTVEVTGKVQVEGPVKVEGGIQKETLLRRGMMALEDGKWDDARSFFHDALNYDAEYAEAYLGLEMCDQRQKNKASYIEAYISPYSSLGDSMHAKRARRFSEQFDGWFAELDEKRAHAEASLRQVGQSGYFVITDRCIGCTKCARICPAGAIYGKVREKHVIDAAKCMECGTCKECCPVGAILKRAHAEEALRHAEQPGHFEITDKCIGCTKCARYCPAHAIYGKVRVKHVIDPDKCTDCGMCKENCPVGAII